MPRGPAPPASRPAPGARPPRREAPSSCRARRSPAGRRGRRPRGRRHPGRASVRSPGRSPGRAVVPPVTAPRVAAPVAAAPGGVTAEAAETGQRQVADRSMAVAPLSSSRWVAWRRPPTPSASRVTSSRKAGSLSPSPRKRRPPTAAWMVSPAEPAGRPSECASATVSTRPGRVASSRVAAGGLPNTSSRERRPSGCVARAQKWASSAGAAACTETDSPPVARRSSVMSAARAAPGSAASAAPNRMARSRRAPERRLAPGPAGARLGGTGAVMRRC